MAAVLVGAVNAPLVRRQEAWTFWSASIALVVFSVLPLLWLVVRFITESPGVAGGALEAFQTSRLIVLLLRSLGLAGAITLLACCIGVPLGFFLAKTDVAGARIILLLHLFPLFLPPFLLGLGWFYLLGQEGAIGTAVTAGLLFSEIGVISVLSLAFAPVVTALVMLGLRGADPALEEAARVAAGPWRVATRILLPAVQPNVVLGALVVFALAVSELGVPMFLRVDVYPAAVFARLGGIDYAPSEALALALPLLPIALLLLAAERRLCGRRSFATLGLRSSSGASFTLGRWRILVSAGCSLLAALSIAPIIALTYRAIGDHGFVAVQDWIGNSLSNSLVSGSIAATSIVLLGLILGHGLARQRRGASMLDGAAVLAFMMPAVLFGLGLIAFWNRPALSFVYASSGIIVAGFVGRYAVIGVRTVATVIAQSPVHFEESAAAAGAGYWRRLARIVLPLHWRGLVSAWLLVLVFCLRDLETAVLFYPPGGEPLTVLIFTLEANGPEPLVAALAIVHTAITAAILAFGALLLRLGKTQ